jgi:hypothetical protein
LRNASVRLNSEPELDTERFLQYLEEHQMNSNVEIEEVPKVEWTDLKGS